MTILSYIAPSGKYIWKNCLRTNGTYHVSFNNPPPLKYWIWSVRKKSHNKPPPKNFARSAKFLGGFIKQYMVEIFTGIRLQSLLCLYCLQEHLRFNTNKVRLNIISHVTPWILFWWEAGFNMILFTIYSNVLTILVLDLIWLFCGGDFGIFLLSKSHNKTPPKNFARSAKFLGGFY